MPIAADLEESSIWIHVAAVGYTMERAATDTL